LNSESLIDLDEATRFAEEEQGEYIKDILMANLLKYPKDLFAMGLPAFIIEKHMTESKQEICDITPVYSKESAICYMDSLPLYKYLTMYLCIPPDEFMNYGCSPKYYRTILDQWKAGAESSEASVTL